MPDFWQFPTGSMGIGPISAIYQARFMRYLDASRPRSMRRPHGVGRVRRRRDGRARVASRALTLAAREKLDNLIFVINCNLQRLDGPVRGNGQIIQELEGAVRRRRLERDQGAVGLATGTRCSRATRTTRCCARFAETVDGQFQTLARQGRRFNREHFFGQNPELRALVAHMTRRARSIALQRGGHDFGEDPRRVRAAARAHAASRP